MADDVNISPEMIENLVNMLKSNGNSDSSTPNSSSNNSTDLNDILKNFSSSNSSNTNNSGSSSLGNIDFETITRMKTVMDTFNSKNSPDSNLLYSLKPYLRRSRQEKLDQYINILKISQISKMLRNEEGEKK